MDITLLGVPALWVTMGFGAVLLFISFFIKSVILNLAIITCMVGVLVAPEEGIDWVKASALLIMLWAIIDALRNIRG
jgi:hypothetical protein